MSAQISQEGAAGKIRVAVIGAGISGLALANGLLNDPRRRYDVQVYERDTVAFDLERGGYQLRMAYGGIEALKSMTDIKTWNRLKIVFGEDPIKAPSMVNPQTMECVLNLADVKVYPKSFTITRTDLKLVLLERLQEAGVVHFSCPFERYELLPSKRGHGEHEVAIHFQDPAKNPVVHADIVVAADGSNSRINRQAGINNKRKIDSWTMIQSRGALPLEVYKKLPHSLTSQGASLYMGGTQYTGFASVYKLSALETQASDDHHIFWSALIPQQEGSKLLERAGDDKVLLVKLLSEYVSRDLNYNVDGLPLIFNSATESVRTGAVTTSLKPTKDWREGKAANSRIVIIGDAIHPMTPGRGMGANQALLDAGNLVKLLQTADFPAQGPTEAELHAMVTSFDAEMYARAFKMVKASEDMSALDFTTPGGRVKIAIGKVVLGVIGFVVGVLEIFGLYKCENIRFDDHPEAVKAR